MRLLILGAGGIGGYYGGRLAEAGADVTFLVRSRRAEQLARGGLVIKSPAGDASRPVKTATRDTAGAGWDAIVLSCKAYDLEDAIETIRPAAAGARIVPLLNGMRHLETLDAAFGEAAVAGGTAAIGVTLEPDGTIRHLAPGASITIGERQPEQAAFCAELGATLARGSGFESRHSREILQDMWEKFIFLTCAAGLTATMRGSIGAINSTRHGTSVAHEMIAECVAVATGAGHPPRERAIAWATKSLTDPHSQQTASMFRDLRQGGRIEADHIVGDMLDRALAIGLAAPMLRAALTHLEVYEANRTDAASQATKDGAGGGG